MLVRGAAKTLNIDNRSHLAQSKFAKWADRKKSTEVRRKNFLCRPENAQEISLLFVLELWKHLFSSIEFSPLHQSDPKFKVQHGNSRSLLLPRSLGDEGRAIPWCQCAVNKAYTSKTCSICGNIMHAKIYSSVGCASVFNRDFNAAKNIIFKTHCEHLMAKERSSILNSLSEGNHGLWWVTVPSCVSALQVPCGFTLRDRWEPNLEEES
mgnify:CR=1 FL=1